MATRPLLLTERERTLLTELLVREALSAALVEQLEMVVQILCLLDQVARVGNAIDPARDRGAKSDPVDGHESDPD